MQRGIAMATEVATLAGPVFDILPEVPRDMTLTAFPGFDVTEHILQAGKVKLALGLQSGEIHYQFRLVRLAQTNPRVPMRRVQSSRSPCRVCSTRSPDPDADR